MNGDEYAETGRTVAAQAAFEAAVKASGFDYAETTLTDAEYAAADPARVKQYERGIITGGELDCLTRFGVMPDKLPVVWFRQIHPTSWVAYRGDQAIWEATTRGDLVAWLRGQGITDATWKPLGIVRVG